MAKNLVVVESPAKAKTLAKYLGRNYQVRAVGHIPRPPKSKLGVDVANDFQPTTASSRQVEGHHRAAQGGERNNRTPSSSRRPGSREGEAIAWHIAWTRSGSPSRPKRVLFNEITKDAVQKAIKNPLELNSRPLRRVAAAPRSSDRLVGLPGVAAAVEEGPPRPPPDACSRWRCASSSSASADQRSSRSSTGRSSRSSRAGSRRSRRAPGRGRRQAPGPEGLPRRERAGSRRPRSLDAIRRPTGSSAKVETKERKRQPQPPFITSRLQQRRRASTRSAPADDGPPQRLYEGVASVTRARSASSRTCVRTRPASRPKRRATRASTSRASTATATCRRSRRSTARASEAQDAHEAIRPTSME